jgi:hypothetical protein
VCSYISTCCACSCLGSRLPAAWPHASPHLERQVMLWLVRMQRVYVLLQVYMQPSGLLSMSGLASSTPFLKDFFSKWRVRPFFVAREEYKNVANQFNEVSSCAPHWHVTMRETEVGAFYRTSTCPAEVDNPHGRMISRGLTSYIIHHKCVAVDFLWHPALSWLLLHHVM